MYYLPQYRTTTLSAAGGINSSVTTGLVVLEIPSDVVATNPGIVCLTYSNPLDTDTAEFIKYTSIDTGTKELQGVTRGQEGYSAKGHDNGSTIAWIVSKSHINDINDKLTGVNVIALSDTNGNELLKTSTTTAAVNEVTLKNAATSNAPSLTATGGDTNIDISVVGKGTGGVKLGTGTVAVTDVLDEDTMSSNSAVKLATQQSIKAYVDTPRILSAASYTTDTGTSLNIDNLDQFIVTAQAGALLFNNPTGTPKEGQRLLIAVTGTAARALTYGAQFEASTVALPTTTVTTARLNMEFIWRADTSKWVITSAGASGAALSSKTITLTRDMAAASGDVSYTGIGFVPTSIIFMASVSNLCISNGCVDSARAGQCIFSAQTASYLQSGQSGNAGLLVVSANYYITWNVASFNADGFTLTFTKVNLPTGTASIVAICFR